MLPQYPLLTKISAINARKFPWISNVALRTILSPGKWSDFLLLWSLWRHVNSAKNVNHFEFGLCDWIIKQKAHYKPWVTEIARKQAKDTKCKCITCTRQSREFYTDFFKKHTVNKDYSVDLLTGFISEKLRLSLLFRIQRPWQHNLLRNYYYFRLQIYTSHDCHAGSHEHLHTCLDDDSVSWVTSHVFVILRISDRE